MSAQDLALAALRRIDPERAHRLAMAGYDWNRADENIAAGFRTLDTAMKAWIDSPSHCKALMRADVVDVGVAVIPGEASNTYLSYWAMVLAAPR